MKILFYAPFKPLGHPHPSGDLITATGIYNYLEKQGHEVITASRLRCRWIYWKPWLWPKLLLERRRIIQQFFNNGIDLWFTYHSYYKAPDLMGTVVSRELNIPYVIFQGIYSTKRRRRLKTRMGFHLNKKALMAADFIFSNKKVDLLNLKRLVPEDRLTFISPGLKPDDFCFDANARAELREQWNVGDDPVVVSAAMFRPGVKTEGLTWVIKTCGELFRNGQNLRLVIAGDGKEKDRLHRLAQDHLPDRVRFVERCRGRRFTGFIVPEIYLFFRAFTSLSAWFILKPNPAVYRWLASRMRGCPKPFKTVSPAF